MIDNKDAMPLITLKNAVEQLANQKFGSSDLFDLDELLENILIYHDIHQVLQQPGIRLVLNNIITNTTTSDGLVEALSALNAQIEGLRCILLIFDDEHFEETFTGLTSLSFLNDAEVTQLSNLVQLYALALQKVDDLDDIAITAMDTDAMVRCLTREVITAYLEDLYNSRQWLQPMKILFAFDKFAGDDFEKDPSVVLSFMRSEFLRNEDEYNLAIEHFEKIGQPFLADAARLLLFFSYSLRNPSKIYTYVEKSDIQQVLNRLDRYQPDEWFVFAEMQPLFKVYLSGLYMILGSLPSLQARERSNWLEKAEQLLVGQILANPEMLSLRVAIPSLRWMRAQLLPDSRDKERGELEASALECVYEQFSECVLAEKTLDRVVSMTTLMILPVQWKIAKRDFRSALENVEIARSLARALTKAMRDEMDPAKEEIEKILLDPYSSQEEKAQALVFQNVYEKLSGFANFWTFSCNLLIHTSNAKLAESQGDFDKAGSLYEKAENLQKDIIEQITDGLSIYMNTPDGLFGSSSAQYKIWATYFQGMASLNRGDQRLIERSYHKARENYQDAKQAFNEAASSWTKLMEQFTPSELEGPALANAERERRLTLDRVRYCDAKNEMAHAQESSASHNFGKASEHFDKAADIFAELELLNDPSDSDRETSSNPIIFTASKKFCKGCALFETARDVEQEDILKEAVKLVYSAASLFDEVGEARWAKYIRALRFEYEADIYRRLVDTSTLPQSTILNRIQSAANEANTIFQELGVKKHVLGTEHLTRPLTAGIAEPQALTIFAPPKPADSSPMSNNVVQSTTDQFKFSGVQLDQLNREDQLKRLFAEARVLNDGLLDLKTRRDLGIIEEGRYMLLATGQEQRRISILQKVRQELEGQNQDFDILLQDALVGVQESILMARLEQVAQQQGMDGSRIKSLKKGQGSLLCWLIEVGIQLTKR